MTELLPKFVLIMCAAVFAGITVLSTIIDLNKKIFDYKTAFRIAAILLMLRVIFVD